jgi:inosose dehydratase
VSGGARVAGAPISWGVIEVPHWGYQMPAERVLREAASVGLEAMEAGPEAFLPQDPDEVSAALFGHGLGLVGGFVPAVLHDPGVSREGLDLVERRARFFSAAGADTLVLAAATGSEGYKEAVDLDEAAWKVLFENLSRVGEIAARYGVTAALHPHYGTAIETDEQLSRFLEGCDTGLCLDTGHLVIGGSDPVEVAGRAADRVVHVHFKDVDSDLARRLGAREIGLKEAVWGDAFRPLGEGDVDLGRLTGLLEGAGYSGWYVLEQDIVIETEPQEGEGPVVNVRKSLGFLERRLEALGEQEDR